jgi:hypothetical protein
MPSPFHKNVAKNRTISIDIGGNRIPADFEILLFTAHNGTITIILARPDFFCYQLIVVRWQVSNPLISPPFAFHYVIACACTDK